MSRVIPLIAADEVPAEGMRRVQVDGIEPLAVYRVGGRFFATQDTCTHALASLCDGWLEGHEVVCPVHEARFDVRDGRPQCFPATEALRCFPAELREGMVCADLASAKAMP